MTKIIGETKFFREKKTFDTVKLIIEKNNLYEFEFWSAACATGEEAYSLAIMFYEMGLESSKAKIYATDICKKFLRKAERGIYTKREIERSERKDIIKYFEKIDGDKYKIRADIKAYITFQFFDLTNFTAYTPLKNRFTFIFLRNVLIYFPPEVSDKIFEGTLKSLKEEGYLFLGNKEVIYPRGIEYFKGILNDTIYYKKERTISAIEGISTSKPERKTVFSDDDRHQFLYRHKGEKGNRKKGLKYIDNGLEAFLLHIKEGNIKEAKGLIHFVEPRSSQYYFMRGLIEELNGRDEIAEEFYRKSIEIDPEFPLSHLHLGNIYYNNKKYREAYREYLLATEGIERKKEWFDIFPKEDLEFIKNFLKNRVGT